MAEIDDVTAAGAAADLNVHLFNELCTYLKSLCPTLLNGDASKFSEALTFEENEDILKMFISDSQLPLLCVQKRIQDLGDEKTVSRFAFDLQMKPSDSKQFKTSKQVAFIKPNPLQGDLDISDQLHLVQLQASSPFNSLLSYVKHSFIPYTRGLITLALERGLDKKTEDIEVIRGVNSKLGELEVELLRSQQSIEIPHISLEVNRTLQEFVDKQAANNKALSVEDLPASCKDAGFLNDIQRGLNEWKKQILSVTSLTRDVTSGSTIQEVNFWMSKERAINHIYEEREKPGVEFTFQILKENKRFLATTGFMSDVGLSADGKEKDKVHNYSDLLRELPIKRLLSASNLEDVCTAIELIFNHLRQIRRVNYPASRAFGLVQTISRDVAKQVQTILNNSNVMNMDYLDFEEAITVCEGLFVSWRENLDVFSDILRKDKREALTTHLHQQYPEFKATRQRVFDIQKLRKEHHELKTVITDTLTGDRFVQQASLKSIAVAYQYLRDINVLSITNDGKDQWARALNNYAQKIDHIERELEEKVREFLEAAKDDANEMFRVCHKFNALFVRPRIQGAIREYQEQLMSTVKKDIVLLQEKFKSKYTTSEARRMSTLHDLPPVAGAIIWANQIERQLDTYMHRIEDVLGKQWHHHIEGKQLKRECDQFKKRLQPTRLFKSWVEENQKLAHFEVESRIFTVRSNKKQTSLAINFDPKLVTLFKEVRNLHSLGLKVPYKMKIAADEARESYPFAMRLGEVIRIYTRTCNRIDENKSIAGLAAASQKRVQEKIARGIHYQWETDKKKLKNYTDQLGTESVEFQDQVDELLILKAKSDQVLKTLQTCKPDVNTLQTLVTELQSVIDQLDKRGYSNLGRWVTSLDERVEQILVTRLRTIMNLWMQALEHNKETLAILDREEAADALNSSSVSILDLSTNEIKPDDLDESKLKQSKDEKDEKYQNALDENEIPDALTWRDFVIQVPSRHVITIRNQLLQCDPPLEQARLHIAQELQHWLSSVLALPRLKCFWTSDTAVNAVEEKDTQTYRTVLAKLSTEDLRACFDKIESVIKTANKYVSTWLEYQALWDMHIDSVAHELGNDVRKWELLLVDMSRSRKTFDSSATEYWCGPIVIEYGSVQSKINDKYDSWHKSLLARFGTILGDMMHNLYQTLQQKRALLEKESLDFSSTDKIVGSVLLLQELSKKSPGWAREVESHKSVEQLLQRQRFLFPDDWLHHDRLQGEYQAFEQILQRKLAQLKDRRDDIQSRIVAENNALEDKIKTFVADWKQNRPLEGGMDHRKVQGDLELFASTLSRLEEDVKKMGIAKMAMEMKAPEEYRLAPIREELAGLQQVWAELGQLWNQLDELREKKFVDIKPIDVRRTLNRLQDAINDMDSALRQYKATEHLKDVLREHIGVNHMLVNLNSGVLRRKHQAQILKTINMTTSWRDMTLADLYDCKLKLHQKNIEYILAQAQGESALEEFLSDLAHQWERTKLDLVDYRGKCFLIRNFADLFTDLTDHLGSIQSMKGSPFFKAFENEALQWEQKLNQAQAIFDVFIDVQRRWVYLEGIFTNSQDVQNQLAYQYQKFRTFDRDFVRMMREIKREDSVDYWIKEEQNLLSRLEDYLETLNNIQKALGEYLEKQRASFPRFYFVGDEDLLEIIGNAKDALKVVRHLPKMFAGVETLLINNDDKHIVEGIISKEGEVVQFKEPFSVENASRVQDWLQKVEYQMRHTLSTLLAEALRAKESWGSNFEADLFFKWVDSYPAQIALLSTQVSWSEQVDEALKQGGAELLKGIEASLENLLSILADRILLPGLRADTRKKYEQLITELVHQRDVTRDLFKREIDDAKAFEWLTNIRFYFDKDAKDSGKDGEFSNLRICISRATFFYGWEYLGVGERLVQTPLTDRAYLTLAEALHMRLGGNPFGPAGTGKTETVKALGAMLGRFVLVFNCDENFDLQAMGRIFVGLCQCGAWGCFDEFNRLEERILSAVSQQILTIQIGLRERASQIAMIGKNVILDPRVGLFVTMNPGYAGRSNLPDNLKQLFRGIAMIKPNRKLICEVMLYSQGFRTAEDISGKVVMLFELCDDQLSNQSHYDFGLRALKSVLRSAGALKRKLLAPPVDNQTIVVDEEGEEIKQKVAEDQVDSFKTPETPQEWLELEISVLIKSICGTIVPKLISEDVTLFGTLLSAVFPDTPVGVDHEATLRAELIKVAHAHEYIASQGWVDKVMQLYAIQKIHHGVIMVGPTSTGKTSAWTMLNQALENVHGRKVKTYVLDPKAISKDELYGTLDPTTLEWTNGVFTAILRKIIDNVRDEASQDHWIIFDGDVDPEWAENLNSVLDDNKLLTLPNGERLALTPNIRILFEVENLDHATLATVSRCGMVWFSEEVVSPDMMLCHALAKLRNDPISSVQPSIYNRWKKVQKEVVEILEPYFGIDSKHPDSGHTAHDCFLWRALEYIQHENHVMKFTRMGGLTSMFTILKGGLAKVIEYNDNPTHYPLNASQLEAFATKQLVFAVLWGFGGSLSLKDRLRFCKELHALTSIKLPDPSTPLLDFEVVVDTQEWELWADKIEIQDLEPQDINRSDIVIETVDTARHVDVLGAWLSDHRPLILCGPPGSGKSMTLTAVLRSLPDFEPVILNFSSTTAPDLLLRTFAHYCKTQRTPNGLVMTPVMKNKQLVIFCDEINLPANDAYGTQHIITFLRQLTEQGGYWQATDPPQFVTLERIQIVGACNPPTDAGRVPMSTRFLRHCPILFVDFPAAPSLRQIYGTFNRALLKLVPSLRSHGDALTEAMIELYSESQAKFTPDLQPHYIYSPRELSRWVRAMYEALSMSSSGQGSEGFTLDDMVRLWAHEALRLFQDRLVELKEREWTDDMIDQVAMKHFPSASHDAIARPILFSNWLTKQYISVGQEELRVHVKNRLRVFYEEELDVHLVIFDEVLSHILRIDRVLRQPLGHLLLVGASGSGKTILSKFVSWMNGMSVFQIKVHKNYAADDFDKDLREVLTRAGCKGEKICFIFDESNVLSTAFLERMNALLAGGEVPGLFEGPDLITLMQELKENARKEGVLSDNEDELFKRFTREVQRNLHVVFTMNPSNDDFDNRSATSPALFNRCVIDWFGEWSPQALYQVGEEFTRTLDLGDVKRATRTGDTQREALVNTLVYVHQSVHSATQQLATSTGRKATFVTPRHYLDFISHYQSLFNEKRTHLEDQQRHLNTGLRKLRETHESVMTLREGLTVKERELKEKEVLANDKLEQMMIDKQEAESKRDVSEQIAKEIAEQEEHINARRVKVEADLAQAKPALEEAEHAVRGIKKTDLQQVASFPNPPAAVKLALEPVVLMLGEHDIGDWKKIRSVLRRADFIKSVVRFDVDALDSKLRHRIAKKYLKDPNFDYEKVYRASKACGPLVKWVASTINFSEIKASVQPLTDEVNALAAKQQELVVRQEEITRIRDELEERIAGLKQEYSVLIGEVHRIKAEMESVTLKVQRSMKLLNNLGSERERWENDSDGFQSQIATVPGDSLLSAAFLAYIGYFNQQYRQMLVQKWQDRLMDHEVPTSEDLSLIQYLSHPSQRLEWRSHSLPLDDLCTENAIMLTRFNRYPLIIDPSGQATTFLMNAYEEKKIIRTSFLDDAFIKNLESALRFGNALLVEDVESIDPVLNSVLNKEVTKTGGRVMITVGDKEIDFSPAFTIFLSTRDPTCHFTPDLCSRVTFVNFTVTPGSLTSQCLSKALKAERADIDNKRSDLLKLQGEFRVRLRHLEEELLNALNTAKGNILENDEVITTLETVKKEAEEINEKMKESALVMEEVDQVSAQYRPFASACSSIYFSMENLGSSHYLYQFSLPFFMSKVDNILTTDSKASSDDADSKAAEKGSPERIAQLTGELFTNVYGSTSRGLMHDDAVTFGVRLAQIYLQNYQKTANGDEPGPLDDRHVEFVTRGKGESRKVDAPAVLAVLERAQQLTLGRLIHLNGFDGLISHLNSNSDNWIAWIRHEQTGTSSEESIKPPQGWEPTGTCDALKEFYYMMLSQAMRPDLVPSFAVRFVDQVFGPGFRAAVYSQGLEQVVSDDTSSQSPLLLISKPGYDASTKVDALASSQHMSSKYESFAMGSPEGYELADRAITSAAKKGTWVLLKNVHLSPNWLGKLEKRLHRLHCHPNFRLFMTMELNPSVPANLFRLCTKMIFEPPVGIKSSLLRIFNSIPAERVNKAPVERSRLYFLLAWLHTMVLERLRYVPLGWTKSFEFSESDQMCAMDMVDEWIDTIAQDRANLAPKQIPWNAIRSLLGVIIGGRIDNAFDLARLDAFLDSLFTELSYNSDFSLCTTYDVDEKDPQNAVKQTSVITIPDCNNFEGFAQWVKDMEDVKAPELLGLPNNAQLMLLIDHGERIRELLRHLQPDDSHDYVGVDDDDDDAYAASSMSSSSKRLSFSSGRDIKTNRPPWMVQLADHVNKWKQAVPPVDSLDGVLSGADNLNDLVKNPVYRCMQREYAALVKSLSNMWSDMNLLDSVFSGETKADNVARNLFAELRNDVVPTNWKFATKGVPSSCNLWVEDFVKRINQLMELKPILLSGDLSAICNKTIWLGGLIAPEAFVAATRQAIAQLHNWSLERLQLSVTVDDSSPVNDCFSFEGLSLHGSVWVNDTLAISKTKMFAALPPTRFSWKYVEDGKEKSQQDNTLAEVPVYLDDSRTTFLFSIHLARPDDLPCSVWSQRGTCVTVWSAHA